MNNDDLRYLVAVPHFLPETQKHHFILFYFDAINWLSFEDLSFKNIMIWHMSPSGLVIYKIGIPM